jgi:sugar phosphate isomerase/epimerase
MFVGVHQDYSSLDTIRRTGGIAPAEHWAENLRIIRETTKLARNLGLRRIGFHAGYIPAERNRPLHAAMLERVGEYADIADASGIELVIETAEPAVGTLLEFLNQLGRANVGVNFDPGNMHLYGNPDDPAAGLERLLPWVRQVHLKDARRANRAGEWGEELPLGQGQVDWPAIFRILAESGFKGPLLFERKVGPDPIGDLRQAQVFVRELLGRI